MSLLAASIVVYSEALTAGARVALVVLRTGGEFSVVVGRLLLEIVRTTIRVVGFLGIVLLFWRRVHYFSECYFLSSTTLSDFVETCSLPIQGLEVCEVVTSQLLLQVESQP